jgi:hypothetical protein
MIRHRFITDERSGFVLLRPGGRKNNQLLPHQVLSNKFA